MERTTTTKPEYIKLNEAAQRLGCTPRTLQNWQARRLVPFYRIGRSIRFKASEIEKHLQSRCHIEAR